MSSKLEDIEKRRAARKAELQAQADEQRVLDLEALDAAEVEHGDTSVAHIDVPYTSGLPTMVVVRAPKDAEIKRYRAGLKVKDGQLDTAASNAAAEQLGAVCVVYPDKETFAKMCEARAALKSQVGARASALSTGKAAEEGKG